MSDIERVWTADELGAAICNGEFGGALAAYLAKCTRLMAAFGDAVWNWECDAECQCCMSNQAQLADLRVAIEEGK